jgi:hypothetical protein
MSNSINLSFRHFVQGEDKQVKIDDEINATVAKRNGVLDFKSILITAKDGQLDDAKASEQEAIRQLINNRAGAVDFLKSRNIFTLDRFAPGTTAVAAANLVLNAEIKGEPLPLAPVAPQSLPSLGALGTPSSAPQAVLNTQLREQLDKALTTLKEEYGLFDLKGFPAGINAIQALNYIQSGYADVAQSLVEGEFATNGLAVLQKFANDVPSVKRLLTADQSQLKTNVKPDLRALQLLQEEEAAKATLLSRFNIDFDQLDPQPEGTAIGLLRRQLGGAELPSVAEAQAINDLRSRVGGSEQAFNNLLAQFPAGTTASQVVNYWDLTTPNADLPTPPPPGTNLGTLLNRLAADALVKDGIYSLKGFPANSTTLQAWEIVKSGQSFDKVQDLPSLQGPRIEGTSGIIKIRTPKEAMAKLAPAPAVAAQPAAVLKGFDVVNQLVQWRVELKDPSQLATLSQQGITRDALRELTQPITPVSSA